MKKSSRRRFVKNLSGLAVAASALPWTLKTTKASGTAAEKIPMRVLGRTGEKVSLLCTGGYHIGKEGIGEEKSIELIRKSIDNGVNFLDNAYIYQDGRSETWMGQALKDGYRKKVLLMTKFTGRTLDKINKQLEETLKRFDLDSFDLMQFHAIGSEENDVDSIYNNGLIEWAEQKRSEGVFKYIGFTGHTDPQLHVDMIERGYPWDTMQIPLNPGDYNHAEGFEKKVLDLAIDKNIGIIAMKSNGGGKLGESGTATPLEGLRYAMSLPVASVVSGMDSMEVMDENLDLFRNFTAMSHDEREDLLARVAGHSEEIEYYKHASHRHMAT